MINDKRAAFERELVSRIPNAQLQLRDADDEVRPGEYEHATHEFAWQIWQAAIAHKSEGAVPAGWKLVPIEPTVEMKVAGDNAPFWCADKYRAMVAASPAAPVAAPVNAVEQVSDEMIERVARSLWSRYAPDHQAEWADAPKDEWRRAASETLVNVFVRNAAPAPHSGEAAPVGWHELRNVVNSLRIAGSYSDEEGEATDALEALVSAHEMRPPVGDAVAWWRSPHQIVSDHHYQIGIADEIKASYRPLGFIDAPIGEAGGVVADAANPMTTVPLLHYQSLVRRAAAQPQAAPSELSDALMSACADELKRRKLTSYPLKLDFARENGLKDLDAVHAWMTQVSKRFEGAVIAAASATGSGA